jgi:hypothetical protein
MVPVSLEHVPVCCSGKTVFVSVSQSRFDEGTGMPVSEPVQPRVLEISGGGFDQLDCSPDHSSM